MHFCLSCLISEYHCMSLAAEMKCDIESAMIAEFNQPQLSHLLLNILLTRSYVPLS